LPGPISSQREPRAGQAHAPTGQETEGMAMKYGLDIPTAGAYADARKLAELAAEAEEAGWDGFFIWDVLFAKDQAGVPE